MTETARAVQAGDRRSAARLLTRAEAGDPDIVPTLQALYRAGGCTPVIGVTGPPGAGKSTLVDRLIADFRARSRRVAVLAVDPSSPFSGGAVLGDRVRMGGHCEDQGVLIRSMAARGALGGLAAATGDALTILDAMGFDVILVETVGVGQGEIDILAHADVVVLLQTAHGGDEVQAVKAGVLEIADVLVVNKADAPGTERMVRALKDMAAHSARADGWTAPVLATEAATGRGVEAVVEAIQAFLAHRADRPEVDRARRLRQARSRVQALGEAVLRRRLGQAGDPLLDEALEALLARETDPHALVERLFRDQAPG